VLRVIVKRLRSGVGRLPVAWPVIFTVVFVLGGFGAQPASAQPSNLFGGEAFGLSGSNGTTTTTFGDTGPLPDSGGSLSASATSAAIPDDATTTGALTASVSGSGSQAQAGSTAQSVSILGGLITATSVTASANVNCDGESGAEGTQFSDLSVLGLPIVGTPAPNTQLTLPGVGYVVLNEQDLNGQNFNGQQLIVNGIDVYVTLSTPLAPVGTEIIAASSTAEIACPPVTTITLDPASPNGTNSWYTGPVGVTISATDTGGPGVAATECELDPATVPTTYDSLPSGPCSLTSVSTDGTHTIYAASIDDNGTEEPVESVTFKIDQTPPVLAPSISPGTTLLLNQTAVAKANATDQTSGVATSGCGPVITSTVGQHTLTCTATDNAGNTATATLNYTVGYGFSFVLPMDAPPKVNAGLAAFVYPLVWRLTDANGKYVSTLSAITSIAYKATSCSAFTTNPAGATATSAIGPNHPTYDPKANAYLYAWATPRPKGCYTLFLTLNSGQVEPAYFDLR